MSPSGSSSQPGDGPGAHSPSIRPCSRWGLAAAASPQSAGRSYRPISPLSRQAGTVCFCATFRLLRRSEDCRRILGVTQHPARRSPDFPPQHSGRPDRCGGHPAYPAPIHPPLGLGRLRKTAKGVDSFRGIATWATGYGRRCCIARFAARFAPVADAW